MVESIDDVSIYGWHVQHNRLGIFLNEGSKTGEQCFSKMTNEFFQHMEKMKNESRPGDSNYEQCQKWHLTRKELDEVFHFTRATHEHLSKGENLTLKQFMNVCRAIFSVASSEWDCLVAWANIAELLFFQGHDDKLKVPLPFHRKPMDIIEDIIQKQVEEEVKRRLFLADLKKKTDALKD